MQCLNLCVNSVCLMVHVQIVQQQFSTTCFICAFKNEEFHQICVKQYVVAFTPITQPKVIQLVYSIYVFNSQAMYYRAKYAEIYCLQQVTSLINEVCC